ncbi:hypothetical protein, partial [Xanthomonas oryzae]
MGDATCTLEHVTAYCLHSALDVGGIHAPTTPLRNTEDSFFIAAENIRIARKFGIECDVYTDNKAVKIWLTSLDSISKCNTLSAVRVCTCQNLIREGLNN